MLSAFIKVGLVAASALALVSASTLETRTYESACSASVIGTPSVYNSVYGANITNLTAAVMDNYLGTGADVCLVSVTLTHPGAGDVVHNQILLPLTNWNGIFQGVGGGGYLGGVFLSLAPIAAQGYACASTDTGHSNSLTDGSAFSAASWALASVGNVNQYLLLDFAYRSVHDMTVLGKAVTQAFYSAPIKYSYWNGCSTGGRQGLVEAQKYPEDYDGILAEAPAVQWNDFTPAQQWPYTVIANENFVPLQCELAAINAAAIAACDGLDGLLDSIISAPGLCNFTAHSLVGKSYTCSSDGSTRQFLNKTATIADLIWQGPRTPENEFLWYGITKGTNFSTLAVTTIVNGTAVAEPFGISDTWTSGFLIKDLSYNTSNITYEQFTTLFRQGHQEYDSTMGSADPNLRAFKQRGGKLITWQGLADNYINPQGTILYYEKVAALDPAVHDFYRTFFSPGVGHCGGGTGVQPLNPIGQLRAWVENGTAPATLSAASHYAVGAASNAVPAAANVRFQNLCPYPTVNKYVGGDANNASSFVCAYQPGWEYFPGPNGTNYQCGGGPGWYAGNQAAEIAFNKYA